MRRRPVVEVTTKGSWIATEEPGGALAEPGRGLALMRALTDLELQLDDGCVTIRFATVAKRCVTRLGGRPLQLADHVDSLGSGVCARQDAIDVADPDDAFDNRGRTKLQDDRAPILARVCSQAG